MNPINIYSLLQAKSSLSNDAFNQFQSHYGINIRDAEFNDLDAFANAIKCVGAGVSDFSDFYVGYKIPQIGKEFDLLRFCRDATINVELKSNSELAKIRAQLLRNKYYLSFIGKPVHAFSFVSSSGSMYRLDENDQLTKVSPEILQGILNTHAAEEEVVPDALFNPSDYLVSPFNSTEKFLAGGYFLTHQQEDFKSQILSFFNSTSGPRFIAITGSAGTGKTLLTFDVAKHLINAGKKVLVIHCGQLNPGHRLLAQSGWNICAIKEYKTQNIAQYDAIFLDEAQRIYPYQLNDIVSTVSAAKCSCIFSYDKIQTLANSEARNDIAGKIGAITSVVQYKLSEKIRTNKEVASFIKLLFNRNRPIQTQNGKNILVTYFNNSGDAKLYLNSLDEAEWEVLRFTPSQYDREHHEKYYDDWSKTSHQVIGQEFDSVAIAIDEYFSYDENGDLTYRGGAYYAPTKMLFQNITRARRRLNLVIIGNQQVLNRCLSILS